MDENYFNSILLEKEQKELLCTIVEAARNVPSENRQEFSIVRQDQEDMKAFLQHPGLPDGEIKFFNSDLKILIGNMLIQPIAQNQYGYTRIYVYPKGFHYYKYLKEQLGEPVEHIEKEVRSYIDAHDFQREYPKAFEKWAEAESLLWETETSKQLTKIGHLCREAIQEFMDTLYTRVNPPGEHIPKDKTKLRLKKIIEVRSQQLGDTERKFLDALYDLWDVMNYLIQRQEHGAQKEEIKLIWKDARRVVFQTMMLMFEVSQSLK